MTTDKKHQAPTQNAAEKKPQLSWVSASIDAPTTTPNKPPAEKKSNSKVVLLLVGAAAIAAGGYFLFAGESGDAKALEHYASAQRSQKAGKPLEALQSLEKAKELNKDPDLARKLAALDDELRKKINLASVSGAVASGGAGSTEQDEPAEGQAAADDGDGDTATRSDEADPSADVSQNRDLRQRIALKQAKKRRFKMRGQEADPAEAGAALARADKGRIRVASNVPSAIFVNGKATDRNTPATINVPLGTNEIEVRSLGNPKIKSSKQAVVQAKAVAVLNFTLAHAAQSKEQSASDSDAAHPEKKTDLPAKKKIDDKKAAPVKSTNESFISVSSAPAGIVFIDGKSTGRSTPLNMYKVAPGQHSIEVKIPGKPSKKTTITVKPNTVQPIIFK